MISNHFDTFLNLLDFQIQKLFDYDRNKVHYKLYTIVQYINIY